MTAAAQASPVLHRLIVPHPTRPALLVEARHEGDRLPTIVSEDRHTAEVDHINAAAAARIGAPTTVLYSLRHDTDRATGATTRAHVLELHAAPESLAELPWRALDALRLTHDDAALVDGWRTRSHGPAIDGRAWTRPGWFAAACEWIADTLAAAGAEAPMEIVQLRAWFSSCVLRVRTPTQAYYCKALPESGRREGHLTAFLAERHPDALPPVVRYDAGRRWLLLRGVPGPKLEDVAEVAAWERAAAMYARLQVACIGQADRLRRLGCPQRGLADLEGALSVLAADDDALRRGDSDGLDDAEVASLRAALPALRERCARLRDAAVPLTLEHGDLWPGNFLVDGERCALIDWEDAAVGHPFFSLAPLLVGLAEYQPSLDTDAGRHRIIDAYLEPFAAVAAPDALRAVVRAAMPLAFIDMATRYRLQPPSAAALHPWMRDLVPQTLRLALAAL